MEKHLSQRLPACSHHDRYCIGHPDIRPVHPQPYPPEAMDIDSQTANNLQLDIYFQLFNLIPPKVKPKTWVFSHSLSQHSTRTPPPENWLSINFDSQQTTSVMVSKPESKFNYRIFIRRVTSLHKKPQFKTIKTAPERHQSMSHVRTPYNTTEDEWDCFCFYGEQYELCVGIKAEDCWFSVVNEGSRFSFYTHKMPSGLKNPSKFLHQLESQFTTVQLVSPKDKIYFTNPYPPMRRIMAPDQLQVIGTGQFSVVFEVIDEGGLYKGIVWRRISDLTSEQADTFIRQQRLSHSIFKALGVVTEGTAYFKVKAPLLKNESYQRYSVYMAQRKITHKKFADFYLNPAMFSPDKKTATELEYDKAQGSTSRTTPMTYELSFKEAAVLIIDEIMNVAIKNLTTQVALSSQTLKIHQCGDIKPDNFFVKFTVRDLWRPYSNHQEPRAKAELIDTHPATLVINETPLYAPESHIGAPPNDLASADRDPFSCLLGTNPYLAFKGSILRLNDFNVMIKRTLDGVISRGFNQRQMEDIIEMLQANLTQRIQDGNALPPFDMTEMSLEKVLEYHRKANAFLNAVKLKCSVVDHAYNNYINYLKDEYRHYWPFMTSFIPVSSAQRKWLDRIWRPDGYGNLLDKAIEQVFNMRTQAKINSLVATQRQLVNDQACLATSQAHLNHLIKTILKDEKFAFDDGTIAYSNENRVIDLKNCADLMEVLGGSDAPLENSDFTELKTSDDNDLDIMDIEVIQWAHPEQPQPFMPSDSRFNPQAEVAKNITVSERRVSSSYRDTPTGTRSPPPARYPTKLTEFTDHFRSLMRKGHNILLMPVPEKARLLTYSYKESITNQRDIDVAKKDLLEKISRYMAGHDYTIDMKHQISGRDMGRVRPKNSAPEVICKAATDKTWSSIQTTIEKALHSCYQAVVLRLPGHLLPSCPFTDLSKIKPDSSSAMVSVSLSPYKLFSKIARLPDTNQHPCMIGREGLIMTLLAAVGKPDQTFYVLDFSACLENTDNYPHVIEFSIASIKHDNLELKEPCITVSARAVTFDSFKSIAPPPHPTVSRSSNAGAFRKYALGRIFIAEKNREQTHDIWFDISGMLRSRTNRTPPNRPQKQKYYSVSPKAEPPGSPNQYTPFWPALTPPWSPCHEFVPLQFTRQNSPVCLSDTKRKSCPHDPVMVFAS